MRSNLTVGELKELLEMVPDTVDVVVPVIDEHDPDLILGFRYAKTMGLLTSKYEKRPVFCINTASGNYDIVTQVEKSRRFISGVKCTDEYR